MSEINAVAGTPMAPTAAANLDCLPRLNRNLGPSLPDIIDRTTAEVEDVVYALRHVHPAPAGAAADARE